MNKTEYFSYHWVRRSLTLKLLLLLQYLAWIALENKQFWWHNSPNCLAKSISIKLNTFLVKFVLKTSLFLLQLIYYSKTATLVSKLHPYYFFNISLFIFVTVKFYFNKSSSFLTRQWFYKKKKKTNYHNFKISISLVSPFLYNIKNIYKQYKTRMDITNNVKKPQLIYKHQKCNKLETS